jgi:hypothetical protein
MRFIFTFLLFFAFSAAYSQTNVIQNGGFENWTGGLPDNWLKTTDGYTISQASDTVYEGTSSAKIILTNTTDTQKLRQEDIPIIGGQHYIFKMQVFDNDPAGRLRFWGYWEGEGVSGGPQPTFYTEDSPDWQIYECEYDAPAEATGLSLEIRFYDVSAGWDGDAVFHIDAVEVLAPSSDAPVITNITSGLFAANTPITIQATITDDEGIDTAKVHYKLNLGSEETPVIMTNVSGDLWEGSIPAQTDGTGLEYWISAKDVDTTPNTTTSSVLKTIVGCAQLSKAHELDVNGGMLYKDFMAKVKGIVTAATGTFHATQQDDYIQDENYGINVFSFSVVKSMALNDSVEITGSFDQYNGKSEIIPDTIVILNSGNTPPEPVTVTCDSVNENYEGRLIRIENGIISGWVEQEGVSFTALLNDGNADLDMRVNESTDIDGHSAPSGLTTVIGIASQYDYSSPYTGGYQIIPRCWGDMIVTGINDNPYNTAYSFALQQNYPNPFNPVTEINFTIGKTSDVEIAVYNLLGQRIKTLLAKSMSCGNHSVKWYGKDSRGNQAASGIYIYQLKAADKVFTHKMVLIR